MRCAYFIYFRVIRLCDKIIDMRKLETKKIKLITGYRVMIVGVSVMLLVAIGTALTFSMMMKNQTSVDSAVSKEYHSRYVYIADSNDDHFWREVYEQANEAAEETGVYVEYLSDSLGVNYSTNDLIRVAINSHVDGIIFGGNSDEKTKGLINAAVDDGIGVVVLQSDIESSGRQCFVGVNNYELGQMYGEQVLQIIDQSEMERGSVELLIDNGMSEAVVNVIILAIEDTILERYPDTILPEIRVRRIQATDTFSVEEEIRNIFLNNAIFPNVMICLNGIYTQCAYQAVVDYNKVGETQIIGFFVNDSILEAVDKQIVHSTISVDTSEMGENSIKALNEYCKMGYTNSFLPIKAEIVGREEAHNLLNGEAQSDED